MPNPADLLARVSYLFAFLVIPSALSSQVVYDNGAPDNKTGYNISTSNQANDFQLTASQSLSSFDMYVLYVGTTGPSTTTASFFWQLLTDVAGHADAVLASGNATNVTGTLTSYYCCGSGRGYQDYLFNESLGGITLGAGSYWLAISNFADPANTNAHYWATSQFGTGTGNQSSIGFDGVWTSNGAEGAFAINGVPNDVASTPEPASLTLMASGLVGIAGWARRRRKQGSV